jgi:rare lipoprotein A
MTLFTLTLAALASWYGHPYHGRTTANGETYNMNAMTAAHPSLPFGTKVRVCSKKTGRCAVVRINDRGPFVHGRSIDLSKAAAQRIGVYSEGVGEVSITPAN